MLCLPESRDLATPAQWLAGARPRTLPAAVSPVLAGTGVAAYVDAGGLVEGAARAASSRWRCRSGVNYANDYSDGIRGTDDDRVGPLRLVGSGGRAAGVGEGGRVRRRSAVAALAGLVLAATTAWWLVAVGALCDRSPPGSTPAARGPTATSASAR